MIKKNNKGGAGTVVLITLGVIFLLGFIVVSSAIGSYNNLVNKDTDVKAQWGNVQSSYERRLDLLPNLAKTVKASSDFEKETLIEVARARGGIKVAKNPTDLEEANRPVTALIAGMMTYAEQYPEVKSTELYRGLMDELAGTENRINWERNNYNGLVKDYEQATRRFPGSIIARMFGFDADKWKTFEAHEAASEAPELNFD